MHRCTGPVSTWTGDITRFKAEYTTVNNTLDVPDTNGGHVLVVGVDAGQGREGTLAFHEPGAQGFH